MMDDATDRVPGLFPPLRSSPLHERFEARKPQARLDHRNTPHLR